MATIYDSGWVPNSIGVAPSSGAINAGVQVGSLQRVRVTFAASGSAGVNNGLASCALSWSCGANSPIPYMSNLYVKTPNYPVLPLVTGTYTVAAPAAGAIAQYTIGSSMSGANHVDDWVPETLYVNAVQGSGSYARVIIEGR
jgi:hypothetical protein